jgi:DNA-binding LytR/AlgR family response regulator
MMCEQIPQLEVVKAFNDPENLLKDSRCLDFDLCILDIEMPRTNGLQVAKLLKDKLLIFTTAYKDYAADAFDLNAIDYVRKPIQIERLQHAVDKAVERLHVKKDQKNFAQVNTDKGRSLIRYSEIGYITTSENDSRDKVACMQDGSSMLLKNISFESLFTMLPPSHFCRINKKEIVSSRIIVSFTFNEITTSLFSNTKPVRLSLTEAYRKQFIKFAQAIS